MEKIVIALSLFTFSLWGNSEIQITKTLDDTCLSCHAQQQIPNRLVYKRYLMQYSTDKRMEEAIFTYLKNPSKKTSIMPPQFFLKFPMKEKLHLDDYQLRNGIRNYLKRFDLKAHIIIEK